MPRALWTKAPLALLRHPVGLLSVVAASLLIAMGAAAAPLMNAGAESEALQNKLAQLDPLAAGLTIERDAQPGGNTAAADSRRRAAAVALGRGLPSVRAPVLTTTADAQLGGAAFAVGNPLLVVVMARTAATAHVQRLAGDGRGAWFSGAVAQAVRLEPGKTARLVPASLGTGRAIVRVGAIYRQLDADLSNPYWVNFVTRIRPRNPDLPILPTFVLVPPHEAYRIAHATGGALGNVYEYPIDPRGMTPQKAKKVARAFESVRRSLPRRASLGCGRCRATSSLVDAVRLAARGNAGLTPVISLLAGFCVLLALAAGVIVGGFTGRRRAGEARLSLVLGERALAFGLRSALEALVPALVGAAAGLAAAIALARALTPSGTVDSSVFRHVVLLDAGAAVLAALAVAAGATVARGRLAGRVRRVRLLWEVPVAILAAVAWIVVASGGGLVKNAAVGSHPRLEVLVLPSLVAAALAGAGARALRTALGRRAGSGASTPVFLAVRRVAAARGLLVALVVTVAVGTAALAFAQILRSSLGANSVEKAYVANGSDVQGIVDPGRPVPARFPYPVTTVTQAFNAASFDNGAAAEVIAVEPHSLLRVLAPHWPASVLKAVRALAASRAPLPAIAIGGRRGPQNVFVGDRMRRVDVVATPRLFPGTTAGTPALVVPRRALGRFPGVAFDYVWATGPPKQVERALARSDLAPSYVSLATDLSRSADVTTITRTYGLLRIVALAFAALALVALLLYLSARARAQLVAAEFMRRMGLRDRAQAASVALEAIVLVAFAVAVGLLAAVATSGVIVERVDPLPEYDPPAATVVPWRELLGAGAAVVVVAALAAVLVTLAVRRDRVGEALRVA